MNMMRLAGSAVAATVLIGVLGWNVSSVSAPATGEAVVKERKDTMKRQSADMKSIKQFIDGSIDHAAATKAAGDLVDAAKTLPTLFPKGTGMADFPGKSGAKPVIWSEPDKFLAAQKNLLTELDKLDAAVKSGDKQAIEAQFSN